MCKKKCTNLLEIVIKIINYSHNKSKNINKIGDLGKNEREILAKNPNLSFLK